MTDHCGPADESLLPLHRRTALKAGGALLGLMAFGRFAGLAEAKAAGGSGLVRVEDYGLDAPFDDRVPFRFVRALEEDLTIGGRTYPATIPYWMGCDSVDESQAATKTFQGYLIEDDTGDNLRGGNEAVMYVYFKRPVSWDWHVFVEAETCGDEYRKVGYEPLETGSAPGEPGNRPPDKGDDGDHEDEDGDHEDATTAASGSEVGGGGGSSEDDLQDIKRQQRDLADGSGRDNGSGSQGGGKE